MSRSFRKRLFTQRAGGDRPLLVEAADEADQARFVVPEIGRVREEGVSLGETAVLFRASHRAIPLELLLARQKTRYVKYGGFRFLEAAHLKDVPAHLRVLAKPADELSLAGVLGLCEGIGRAGAQAIARAAAGQASLPEALRRAAGGGRKRAVVEPLARLIEALAAAARPVALVEKVIEHHEPLMKAGSTTGCIPMLVVFGDEEPDEDLRLLYVAVTRAKERLYLVWPRHTGRGYGVNFNQTLDIAYLTEPTFERLLKVDYRNARFTRKRIYFSCNHPAVARHYLDRPEMLRAFGEDCVCVVCIYGSTRLSARTTGVG